MTAFPSRPLFSRRRWTQPMSGAVAHIEVFTQGIDTVVGVPICWQYHHQGQGVRRAVSEGVKPLRSGRPNVSKPAFVYPVRAAVIITQRLCIILVVISSQQLVAKLPARPERILTDVIPPPVPAIVADNSIILRAASTPRARQYSVSAT